MRRVTGDDAWNSGFTWHPRRPSRHDRWSHTSGWMLLSGERRHVSCVIPIRDQVEQLSRLLPVVSDSLTECGYPWELIVVDAGSRGSAVRAFGQFAEIASLSVAVADRGVSRARALLTGLSNARGDAILLLDVGMESSVAKIPQMIERWNDGAMVVSSHDAADAPLAAADAADPAIDTRDFGAAQGSLILLDRSVVAQLLWKQGDGRSNQLTPTNIA